MPVDLDAEISIILILFFSRWMSCLHNEVLCIVGVCVGCVLYIRFFRPKMFSNAVQDAKASLYSKTASAIAYIEKEPVLWALTRAMILFLFFEL